VVSQGVSLKGEVAIVVGNQNFRVKSLALALAEAGAKVAIATPEDAKQLVEGAGRIGAEIYAQTIDITSPEEINNLVEQTMAQWHKVDILVNGANLMLIKPLSEVSQAEWRQVMDVNLTSAFLWCQAVGRQMLKQKRGKIINIISGLSQRGLANGVAYCASQGGVQQMTTALALEWAREGIRVNAIGVGWFAEAIQLESRLERYIPLRRLGMEDDLTSLVVYLASEASEFITGSSFFIDGGVMAHA